MWYETTTTVDDVADYFDVSDQAAGEILNEATILYARGAAGYAPQWFNNAMRGVHRETFATHATQPRFAGVDKHDLGQFFESAWHAGIVSRKLTVRLETSDDRICECGSYVSESFPCLDCGATDGERQIFAIVSAPFAEIWADHDRYIDGSTWESVGNGEIYTILSDRPSLVADLEKEGYTLDTSCYETD